MTVTRDQLVTESDVEQKILLPLLSAVEPLGLGYTNAHIRTKHDIRRLLVGKGKEQKLYYPDYAIVLSGLPVIIVEAKSPDEDLAQGLREARLYATELNAVFPANLNPVGLIICSNGVETILCYWDSSTPEVQLTLDELDASNQKYAELINIAGKRALESRASDLLNRLARRPMFRPTKLIGGHSVRNEEIGHNTFGATLALEYRHLFNPITREERAHIVRNAYIPSKRRERYIEPIDRIIRAAAPPSESDARLIENTDSPDEVLSALRKQKAIEHQVMLLIGGVGVGKSTFVDYLREVKLPSDLIRSTVWVHVNMNNAPINNELIYAWISEQIVDGRVLPKP